MYILDYQVVTLDRSHCTRAWQLLGRTCGTMTISDRTLSIIRIQYINGLLMYTLVLKCTFVGYTGIKVQGTLKLKPALVVDCTYSQRLLGQATVKKLKHINYLCCVVRLVIRPIDYVLEVPGSSPLSANPHSINFVKK